MLSLIEIQILHTWKIHTDLLSENIWLKTWSLKNMAEVSGHWKELESLENYAQHSYDGTGAYVRAYDTTSSAELSDGILGGFEITPLLPFEEVL